MSLSIGIVGLPNVGKSTLFNALTEKSVPAENYPFCTIDPSVGVVRVPDNRLERLSEFSESAQTIPAAVEFVDIAGLVRGASEGEGLGNAFLSNVREVDVIAHMVRVFEDENVMHVAGAVDPRQDVETINLELILADAQTVARRLERVEKNARSGDKDAIAEKALLERLKETLGEGRFASSLEFTEKEEEILKGLHLLTTKPMLYVFNKKSDAKNLTDITDERLPALYSAIEYNTPNSDIVHVDAGMELDMAGLSKEEKEDLRRDMGGESGVDDLIRKGYETLELLTFFTTGETETRAWTARVGSTAPQAGRSIHSDFHDKFIKADVVEWDTLLESGSKAAAREQGLIRTEGKEYVVKDGDVIEFRI